MHQRRIINTYMTDHQERDRTKSVCAASLTGIVQADSEGSNGVRIFA
jgi:hypothetical protein